MSEFDFNDLTPWDLITNTSDFRSLNKRENPEKKMMAEDALAGNCFTEHGKDVYGKQFHLWLRWVQSDDPYALLWWYWMSSQEEKLAVKTIDGLTPKEVKKVNLDLRNRDDYIIQLWHTINNKNANNRQARVDVEQRYTPWSYYTRHFFNWFLKRYNVVDARQVFTQSLLSRYVHIPLSLLSIALVGLFLGDIWPPGQEWLITGISLLLGFVVGNVAARMQPAYFLQSLIPRFAASIAVGYLFLFSASGLVAVLYDSRLSFWLQAAICLVIILAVGIYMVQVIHRQVQPRLPLWRAVQRSFHLLLTGAAHSAIGLWVSAPLLYSETFLNQSAPPEPTAGCLLLTATIALAIGVVLQMVWEDKPVTEPL